MTRSSFITPEDSAHFAPAHDEHGDVIDVASLSLLERKGRRSNAAASLCCTAGDYGRFLAALLAGTGLSESTRRALATPQVEVGPGVAWGLGLGLEQRADGYALWQWGHNTGYRAFALVDPARRSAFVFLSNGDGGMLILRDLLKLASGDAEHPALAHLHYESYDSPGR